MAGKKLPRAIRTTAGEMRSAGAAAVVAEPNLKVVPARPAGAGAEVAQAMPAQAVSPAAEAAMASDAAIAGEPDAAQRRAWAQDIVQRHAAYSVIGGIVPLPIVNAAGVAAINVRMVKVLSELYGVPFERDRTRAIVIALMGGIMPTGVGVITTSTLFTVLPGASLIGLAMSSVTAAACTRGIGRIFVEHFESGATTLEIPAVERPAVKARPAAPSAPARARSL